MRTIIQVNIRIVGLELLVTGLLSLFFSFNICYQKPVFEGRHAQLMRQ